MLDWIVLADLFRGLWISPSTLRSALHPPGGQSILLVLKLDCIPAYVRRHKDSRLSLAYHESVQRTLRRDSISFASIAEQLLPYSHIIHYTTFPKTGQQWRLRKLSSQPCPRILATGQTIMQIPCRVRGNRGLQGREKGGVERKEPVKSVVQGLPLFFIY